MTRAAEQSRPATEDVEVVYATAAGSAAARVPFEPGLTAGTAVHRSGLLKGRADVAAEALVLGVFGAAVGEGHPLEPGDRVEICRPLRDDPRARRRDAAARGEAIVPPKARG